MASSVSTGCKHTQGRPFAGMAEVRRTENAVTFECAACHSTVLAFVCTARAERTGRRCRAIAVTGKAACRMHLGGAA